MNRPTYDELKKRGYSTLDFNRILKEVGITISNKSLQNHLDSNFSTTTDDRLRKIANNIISNYDNLIKTLCTISSKQ